MSGKSFCCLLPDESSSSSDSRNNPISSARIRWTGAAERGQFAESHFPGHLLLLEEEPCSLQWPIVPLQGHLRRQSQQQHNHILWWSYPKTSCVHHDIDDPVYDHYIMLVFRVNKI